MRNNLLKKGLIFGIILLFIGASVVSGFNTNSTSNSQPLTRSWLYVGGDGPGNYSSIQSAIDAANSGDTIFVYNGIYHENVVINKDGISLVGEDKDTTIINGSGTGDVCYIAADWVDITGFTICNAGSNGTPNYDAGIDIRNSDNCIISENVITDNGHLAIYSISSIGLIISNNYISNSERGIYLYAQSNNCTISDNIITGNINSGIYSHDSDEHTIINNCIETNQYGIRFGANCDYCNISKNKISNNNLDGIYLESNCNKNTIICNDISNNWYAIRLWESNDNLIIKNEFNDTQYWAVSLSQSSYNNQLYHNNFYNNINNAWDECTNSWDNGYPSGGNYWSNYTGEDNNHDGIGDIPYNLSGGISQDLYPLMHPFELYYILNISLDSHEVDEGSTFNVTVKTLGGTVVPNAEVHFDNAISNTDNNGVAVITAPGVSEDTVYQIVASKTGYTSDNDTILVKDVPQESVRAFIFGKITNLSSQGDYITFEAVKTRVITFSPPSFNTYVSGEQFTISKDYKGWVGTRFIFTLCKILT
jgi:parallel beta-helix repeat protein